MADIFIKKVPFVKPALSQLEKAKAQLLSAARPKLGGVDVYDLEDNGIAHIMSAVYFISVFVVFVTILSTLTQAQVQQSFLSTDLKNENNICREVPISVTAEFMGSYTGVWNTDPAYSQNETIYGLQFSGSRLTNSEYFQAMSATLNQFYALTQKYSNRGLVYNAILLCNFGSQDNEAGTFFFSFIDADFVFNSEVRIAALSSKEGVCDAYKNTGRYISGEFDQGSKSFVLTVPLYMDHAYMERGDDLVSNNETYKNWLLNKTACPDQEKSYQYIIDTSWSEYTDAKENFYFDIRAVAAAFSLNMGMIGLSAFNKIKRINSDGFALYSDSYYTNPPMSPIWCLDKSSSKFHNFTEEEKAGPEICFIR